MTLSNALVFLDLETSGFDPARHAILQIAWIVEVQGEVVGQRRMDVCVSRGRSIDMEALDVNGFTLARIRAGTGLDYALTAFKTDLVCAEDRVVPVGHNIQFDLSFLRGADSPLSRDCLRLIDCSRAIDTLSIVRWYEHLQKLPPLSGHSLGDVCAVFNVPLPQAHDALNDAEAARKIYKILEAL